VKRRRSYRWDANQRLKQLIDNLQGGTLNFGYDDFDSLAWAQYEDGHYDYRMPDKAGNLFRSQSRGDRKYAPGGKLLETADARFIYDEEGNLIKKVVSAAPAGGASWEYEWFDNGMLKKVLRPDGRPVEFRYDALGRRIEKQFKGRLTRFVWNGSVPLHEWSYPVKDRPQIKIDELGDVVQDHPEPVPLETLVTWVFEDGGFVPAAKIVNGKQYAIITDHLGTPCEAYDENGEKVWACELDIYGKVRKLAGDAYLIPFRYQGQYADEETGLYYNRFRYYSPEEGRYISQDPIRLSGGMSFYGYVPDPNTWVDALGLRCKKPPKKVNLTQEGVRHVKDRHIGNKPGWEHKSKWTARNGEWKAKARDTFRNPDKMSRDGDRYIYEKEYKKPIGKDKDGNDLFKVRVVTEENGDLVTTFPQAEWK